MSRIGLSKSLPKMRLLPFTASLKIIEKDIEYWSFVCSGCSKYGLVDAEPSGKPVWVRACSLVVAEEENVVTCVILDSHAETDYCVVVFDSKCLAVYGDHLVSVRVVFWPCCYPQAVFVGLCFFFGHLWDLFVEYIQCGLL